MLDKRNTVAGKSVPLAGEACARPHRVHWAALLAASVLLCMAGCPRQADEQPDGAAPPFAGQALRLVVLDDPSLAVAIRRVVGEWQARTGAKVKVESETSNGSAAEGPLDADCVIYPSHVLAELAERGMLTPVPGDVLEAEAVGWSEVLPAVREQEASWGGAVRAVPFGSPVLTLYYRADLFKEFDKAPPRTWAEYQSLAEFFHDRDRLGAAEPAAHGAWCGASEPLGEGWAGIMLLARAAAYAKHPYYRSTLFDAETMQPLIDRPAFVRALEELVQCAKSGSADALQSRPDDCRAAFWKSQCAMAVSWPTASEGVKVPAETAKAIRVGFAHLPGAEQVFNPADQAWESRKLGDVRLVPLLGAAGRLGSVLKGSKHQEAAFQLLFTLSGQEWGAKVCASSGATTMFRESQLNASAAWVESPAKAAARQYATVVSESLSSEESLVCPRIPGREQYLAALDEAVRRAMRGEIKADAALAEAAKKWEEITAARGLTGQRKAYQRSLGQTP